MGSSDLIPIALIYHSDAAARTLQPQQVERLASSMEKIGLQHPITVRACKRVRDGGDADAWEIVAGRHRFEAAKRLHWEEVPCVVMDVDTIEARLWEISENQHRADLTALEHDEHVAEWVRLTGDKLAQVGPVSGGGRGNEGGVRAATRDLGIARTSAQRSIIVDSLTPEAKAAAVETGRADNRTALLHAASQPAAQQAEAIRTYEPSRSAVKPAPEPYNDLETEEAWMNAIMRVWNRAHPEWREEFMRRVDVPAFDRTRAGEAA